MLSHVGPPRNKPCDEDPSSSCLFGGWSRETQVGEWELRQRTRRAKQQVFWASYHRGDMEPNPAGNTVRRGGHGSASPHLRGGEARACIHQLPSAIGRGLLSCGRGVQGALRPWYFGVGFSGQWTSRVRESFQVKIGKCWKSGSCELKWKDEKTMVATTTAMKVSR